MNVQVSLPDELNELIEAKVASGLYASPSDVINVALRLFELQQHDDPANVQGLREAYRIGIESGDGGELDIEAIIAEARAQHMSQKS